MKKIYKVLIFIFLYITISNIANAVNVVNSSSKTTSCPGANINKIIYINGNSYNGFVYDNFSTSDDRFISDGSTKVSLWQSDTNLVTGCSWSRLSSLSPGSNTDVVAVGSNCTFNKPTDNTKRNLQFVFNIGYYDIFSGNGQYIGDWNLGYYLNPGEISSNSMHYKSYTNVGFDNLNIHGNECLNIELRYCGDGIVSNGETCDDGNNINGDGCSSTCNIETPTTTSSSSSSSSSSGGGSSSSSGGGSSSSSSSSSSSGGGSSSSSGGGSNYCGDGVVQRPNSNGEMEECDFGSESDWMFCNSNCTYSNLTIPGTCDPAVDNCVITIPNGGSIDFGPSDNVIIGAGMNPYIVHSLGKPYIQNNSDYDMYFDKLCVVDRDGFTLIGSTVCENLGILRSGETKYFSTIPNFVGARVTTGDYADNTLVTTVEEGGIRYDNAYFVAKLDVRVAKSSVVTTGGGTSYLSSTNKVGNISNVANNGSLDPDKNKNFVGVGVSGGSISSYSKDINDSDSVSTIASEGTNQNTGLNTVSEVTGTALGNINSLSDFENYNGIENVFVLKNKNFVVNDDILSGLSGARTYIIDNGDLVINKDISFSDNIAFVVRGGNIKIDKSVNTIDGTYITIKKDGIGGKFLGIGGSTTNRLLVNGSLYGNIDDLISNRTYVKQNSFNQIDVGTIVSFGSALFRKTAPLLSSFIDEYLESEKVAQ